MECRHIDNPCIHRQETRTIKNPCGLKLYILVRMARLLWGEGLRFMLICKACKMLVFCEILQLDRLYEKSKHGENCAAPAHVAK